MSLQYMYVCISAQLPPREQLREGEGEQRWAPRGDGTHRPNFAETGEGGGAPTGPAAPAASIPILPPPLLPSRIPAAGFQHRGDSLYTRILVVDIIFFWCVCVCAVEV